MPRTNPRTLFSPQPELNDFVATLKEMIDSLYRDAHVHTVRSVAPSATDGLVGDMVPVELSDGTQLLYVKFSSGWRYFTPT